MKIPPLSIQPLVENAILHGILKRLEGGVISIDIQSYTTYVEIIITDNGIGMSSAKVEEILTSQPLLEGGIGVANTNRRLTQIFGRGLIITSVVNSGTTVSFRIPINNFAN